LIAYASVCRPPLIVALSLTPVLEVGMTRLALRPFTFSNGATIPAGTLVTVPRSAIHMDGEIYSNPEQFDGFRFSKLREGDIAKTSHQAVTTSPEYLAFGLGRHAW
jgi:cytochrome P450